VVGGVLAAVGVIAIVNLLSDAEVDQTATAPGQAAAELIAALERADTVVAVTSGDFVRRDDGGDELIRDDAGLIQDADGRLTLGFGSWDGVVDSRSAKCSGSGFDGEWTTCTFGDEVDVEDEERIDREVIAVAVTGPDALYKVSRLPDGCHRARLVGDSRFEPTFGSQTTWCFAPSGALISTVTERAATVDETVLEELADDDASQLLSGVRALMAQAG
jgi:hypothetical protein